MKLRFACSDQCRLGTQSDLSTRRTLSVTPHLAFSILMSGGSATGLPLNLPEDASDRQPLENHRYALVGDIRIDNREEIARLLGIAASEESGLADSELFLRAWSMWEKASLDRIVGGFAIAVWDKREQELCLVRDHSGERPVYYSHTPASLVSLLCLARCASSPASIPVSTKITCYISWRWFRTAPSAAFSATLSCCHPRTTSPSQGSGRAQAVLASDQRPGRAF